MIQRRWPSERSARGTRGTTRIVMDAGRVRVVLGLAGPREASGGALRANVRAWQTATVAGRQRSLLRRVNQHQPRCSNPRVNPSPDKTGAVSWQHEACRHHAPEPHLAERGHRVVAFWRRAPGHGPLAARGHHPTRVATRARWARDASLCCERNRGWLPASVVGCGCTTPTASGYARTAPRSPAPRPTKFLDRWTPREYGSQQ